MNLAFLLHIYQPPTQDSKKVEEITQSSYLPLLKSIKQKADFKITLNIPLSLSYLLQTSSGSQVLGMIKELYELEKIELTSTGAYHPLLTKLPDDLIEEEVILNERGLAFYYGKDKGFEGEDALVIKNVVGFFPPEVAIDTHLAEKIAEMGYSWIFADDVAVRQSEGYQDYHPLYQLEVSEKQTINVAVRHKGLSDMISFRRSSETNDLMEQILSLRQDGKDLILALDGEFFGHHYQDGIYFLDSLVSELHAQGIKTVTVGELIEENNPINLNELVESSWGASVKQVAEGNPYPLWITPGNGVQPLLWEVQKRVIEESEKDQDFNIKDQEGIFETYPLWDLDKLFKLSNVETKNEIYKTILLLQSLHSDQFWWASGENVAEKRIYHPGFVKKALDLYEMYAKVSKNSQLENFITQKRQEIESIL